MNWSYTNSATSQSLTYDALVKVMNEAKMKMQALESPLDAIVCTKIGLRKLTNFLTEKEIQELPDYSIGRLYGILLHLMETETGAEFKAIVMKQEGKRVIWVKDNGEIVQ